MRSSARLWKVGIAGVVLASAALSQVTQRVSLDTGGVQGNGDCGDHSVSANGRYVAFDSQATNLVPGDTNGSYDVFVRDRVLGTTALVSTDSAGTHGNSFSAYPSISADGRYVSFHSLANNLVSGDTNGVIDVFVKDLQTGMTERVSVDSSGVQANGYCQGARMSADGRFVAFSSAASNLVPGDTNGYEDIFVRDRLNGTTERVSVGPGGAEANQYSIAPSISGDGRFVAFTSLASNLVPGDTNASYDIFVRDRMAGTTQRVSVDTSGVQGNSDSLTPAISADGRCVAFWSFATNLVPGDTNAAHDVFVRDLQLGTTELVSVTSGGLQGDEDSEDPAISADGRYIAFISLASNLVPGDTNVANDVFVRDRQSGLTERVSVDSAGMEGNDSSGFYGLSISANGGFVAFQSVASNLVVGDTNGVADLFVRDRQGGPNFTSLCDPGIAGVIVCPCSNPPSGPGRGCNNSLGTGGAQLSASGGTYLSSDSLVFTTSGEKPTATSVLLQGTSVAASGVVYGQGVRCVGGTLKRLFTKTASGGSLTVPNFGAGDPTVSARSAAKGNVISAGQSRYYLVFYRDPTVLGGCPASSTFNATQTGVVTWSP